MGFVARVCQPATFRLLICPEASCAQTNIAAVSADGRTVWVLIRRLNSSCKRSIALVVQLIAGNWINRAEGLLVTGPTGVGKSWIACAIGHKACRDGKSVLYQRVPRLFEALELARGDGRHAMPGFSRRLRASNCLSWMTGALRSSPKPSNELSSKSSRTAISARQF